MREPDTTPPTSCPRCQTFLPEPTATCPICGADIGGTVVTETGSLPPDEFAVVRAALADEYDVLDELGRGGMAAVYRARERRLQRDVAIKVLPFTHTRDLTYIERFLGEARIAAQLEHPNIIPIHRVDRAGEVIYFAMKLVRGSSLSHVLKTRHSLPASEIRTLLSEVGDALAYAARRGVVHRDIKPDNILQEAESGRYVVSDFGIARSVEAARLTETGATVGTPRYMSPEQARGEAVDGRSDIYSLGAVAYHCLIGRPPFDKPDNVATLYAHVHEPLPHPTLTGPDERSLFAIIERMLVKDPDGRMQTGEEVVRAATGKADAVVDPVSAATTEVLSTSEPGVSGVVGAMRRLRSAAGGVISKPTEWLRRYRVVRWATRTPRRAVIVVLAGIGLVWGTRTVLHFAVMHRSRCPENAAQASVMLDPIGSRPVGRQLDIYYDVCGLAEGTAYTVGISLSRKAGGIGGLLGGRDRPVAVSFDETARGPATRRHRDITVPDLRPGSYTLAVLITLTGGREIRREHDVQLLGR